MSVGDEALVRSALAGERRSGRKLAELLAAPIAKSVRRVLRKMPSSGTDARDLGQEAWALLFSEGGRRLMAYDSARGISLERYVSVIVARNTINQLQLLRAKRRGYGLIHDPDSLDGACAPESGDPERLAVCSNLIRTIVARIGAELPPRAIEVLDAVYFRDLAPIDAARSIGIRTQVLRSWQTRVRGLARIVAR